MNARTFLNRVYADYLMPDRIGEYEGLLRKALDRGYRHLTFRDYARLLKAGGLDGSVRYFIHRHDIDTDVGTARRMFEAERKLGVVSSAYFRLSTLDIGLMREMMEHGCEASYHYEEIASFCKRWRIKSKEGALSRLGEIRKDFVVNFRSIESRLGYKLATVASHGDFVNRRLGLTNSAILDDGLRAELGIEAESYDPEIVRSFGSRLSDGPYPTFFHPLDPAQAMSDGVRVVFLLTHPRNWRSNFRVNTADNFRRVAEGVCFAALPPRSAR